MNNTIFADRLKEARTAAGLTQAELCKRAGVTAATISAYESADGSKGKNPSLDNALKLAQALNVSLDWLCGFNVKHTAPPIVGFLKLLVELDKTIAISFDEVDLLHVRDNCTLKNALAELSDDDLQVNRDYCKSRGEEITYFVYAAVFHNYHIQHFIEEWQKMRSLYKSNTIDEDLYNLWLDKQFDDIGKTMMKECDPNAHN